MKRILLTMILALVIGGSIYAHETHWPGFNESAFSKIPNQIVGYVQLDGEYITSSMNYASFEVCPFVGEEQRGYGWFLVDYGFSYPVIWGSIYYDNNGGEPVTFKMFDHDSGIEYDICVNVALTVMFSAGIVKVLVRPSPLVVTASPLAFVTAMLESW